MATRIRLKHMHLSDLRDALAALPPDMPVVLDTGGAPTDLDSYRGDYERLSLYTDQPHEATRLVDGGPAFDSKWTGHYEPGSPGVEIQSDGATTLAAEVVRALDLAVGQKFEGYKGGQFEMDEGTLMHSDPYGNYGHMIVGVEVEDGKAVIITCEEAW